MWKRTLRWTALPPFSSLLTSQSHHRHRLRSISQITIYIPVTTVHLTCTKPVFSSLLKPFSSNSFDSDGESNDEAEPKDSSAQIDEQLLRDLDLVISCLRDFGSNGADAKHRLEQSGVVPSVELVNQVLSRLRHDWSAAFTFFLWAGKQPGYSHSLQQYHSMISILGKMRRFDTAWSLVNEMRRGASSIVSPQTLMIFIRKYSAIHDVARAINVFYSFQKFELKPGIHDFQGLLSALCRYKNVEDAEHLLLCNEGTFPFQTKSFNIILNGWCNVLVYVGEAKRFWRFMMNKGIEKDVVSYGCMISCYSKAGKLNDVVKLFNQMKGLGIAPDRKVYNATIYALAKARQVNRAKDLMRAMEAKGIVLNAVTFNSLIRPLCKARRVTDVRVLFDEMVQRGIIPSIRTFHAFFGVLRTAEAVFELMDQMVQIGCEPVMDTYIMLTRKLCRWRQHENVYKLWNQMHESGLSPDRSAYIVLIHGLFLNGRLEEASKFYDEMKEKGFEPESKTEEMITAWFSGKVVAGRSGLP
ncbi:Pentatricopeptide repeat-containing protein [Apostasia shenzhenica]|uniref:Pentatricopeptide repeat-containing protein n=1 Tax=Apostasia shenzhenica TaxID=1088818 RepID=A0A2I0AXM7_9ASPA|nr:Pentatricopeptide repeat-containing protein [Apostasia shenzhenica]